MKSYNKKKALLFNSLILFLGKFSTQFISFLLLPLYTSYFKTEDYGIVDLITITAWGFTASTLSITDSTLDVSK